MHTNRSYSEKYLIAQKALASFQDGINFIHEPSTLPADMKRDSLLKRFTLATDSFWKCVEAYLQELPEANYPMYGPNKILLASVENGIISDEQYRLFVSMIQDRLLEPLGLDKELMDAIAMRVPKYYPAMKTALDHIKSV